MKILYIDPWCADGSNLYYYTTGLAGAMARYAEVTVICQKRCKMPSDASYKYNNVFFPYSSMMKQGRMRQVIRGLEYIAAYFKISAIARRDRYDVIHVEWTLLYSVDSIVLKNLKKKCRLLSLKAHNVLPHSTGNKYVSAFAKIYAASGIILVHGEAQKRELVSLFPEEANKVYIQNHGLYVINDRTYEIGSIEEGIRKRVESSDRIYLFLGRIDADKGADRLIDLWSEGFTSSNSLLVIAGKVDASYEFAGPEEKALSMPNILYIPGFAEDNLLNYLITKCNLIILPYRAGSMSGVAFTAAEFSKPVLATKFGVIGEYISSNNSFLVENSKDGISQALKNIETMSNRDLEILGENLNRSFNERYSWDSIAKRLVLETFAGNMG